MRTIWMAAAAISCAQLGSPAAAEAQAQTLPEALGSAYRSNPTIEAARAQARSTDEGIAQARASFLPQVDVIGRYTTREIDTRGGGVLTSTTNPNSSVSLQVAQPVFTGLRRIGQVQAARAGADSAAEGLRQVEQGVLLQAVAAYVDVRRDAEVVRIRTSNTEVLGRQLQAARDRFEVGEITRTDVAQAEARFAQAQAALAGAQSDYEATRARYVEIIGATPDDLAAPPPAPDLPQSLDEAVSLAERLNPEIARFRAAEAVNRARVRIERSDLLPQVDVVGAIERQEEFPFQRTESDIASATARVTMPLFEGGFSWSRVRQAKIDVERARLQTEEIRRAVLSDVTAAWNQNLAAQRVIESSRQQERAAALAFEGAQEELSVGLRTTLDVLNAQQEALEAQLAVIQAERDAYVAAHALLNAVGALTPQALSLNVSLYDPGQHRRAVKWKIIGGDPIDPR